MAGFTEEQFNALTAALAAGARTVTYGDQTVTYHSLAEMMELRRLIGAELGLLEQTNVILAQHSKGLKSGFGGKEHNHN